MEVKKLKEEVYAFLMAQELYAITLSSLPYNQLGTTDDWMGVIILNPFICHSQDGLPGIPLVSLIHEAIHNVRPLWKESSVRRATEEIWKTTSDAEKLFLYSTIFEPERIFPRPACPRKKKSGADSIKITRSVFYYLRRKPYTIRLKRLPRHQRGWTDYKGNIFIHPLPRRGTNGLPGIPPVILLREVLHNVFPNWKEFRVKRATILAWHSLSDKQRLVLYSAIYEPERVHKLPT